jgi:hypothetical protein
MAIKTEEGKYQCFYCLKRFNKSEDADECREAHDLIYVPISRVDLNRLINFIMYPDMKLLKGTRIMDMLFDYAKKPKPIEK